MPARPYMLVETTWKTVRDRGYDVAVLPWGATEAHNTHLPYGTDNFECDHIAAEAARLAWEARAPARWRPASCCTSRPHWCGRWLRPARERPGASASPPCARDGPGPRAAGPR